MATSARIACFLLCLTTVVRTAAAHPVTIDGLATDWSSVTPIADDLGMVARTSAGAGELIWRDAAGDPRTNVSNPETAADILGVQVTGTATNLYVLVRFPFVIVATVPMIQLALDTDRSTTGATQFLAGTETLLAPNTGAEFRVRTSFTNTLPGAPATIHDVAGTQVATATAFRGNDGIEIAIPWASIGLGGPPAAGIRISVAAFRAQSATTTVEIQGPDAVDVLTDYGDPRGVGVASPGSGVELADSTVNDWIDVFFAANGEVVAPLAVERFSSAGTAATGDWVAIRNNTPFTLNPQDFKVGDSEEPDDGEGLASLPAGSIAAGGLYFLATNGASYQTFFGVAPNAETNGSSPTVPDALPATGWSTTAMGLNDPGDQILVVDPTWTILDVVTWGNGTAPGVTPLIPAPTSNAVAARVAPGVDTDDCTADFAIVGPSCGPSTTCATCRACTLNACGLVPAGTSCTDGNACNGAETCTAGGTCSPGTPLTCADGNPCTTDSCAPASGCVFSNVAAGTSCADGNLCNGAETCNAGGVCQAGSVLNCADTNPCTTDACNPATGCTHTNLPAGSSCTDGNACNGAETCSAGGVCQSGTPPTCNDANPCTADSCSPASGCQNVPVSLGTPCPDGNACNGDERCLSPGVCTPGSPISCNDSNPCTSDSCVPATGCVNAPLDGQACNDGDPCNGSDECSGSLCKPSGPPITCDDSDPCTVDACTVGVGCTTTPSAAGTKCDDGVACTSDDVCNGAGACRGSTIVCTPPGPVCFTPTVSRTSSNGQCVSGTCTFTTADTTCVAGCNSSTGLCASDPCAGVTCASPPSSCHQSPGTCNAGTCSYALKPAGAACNDGNACTAVDQCSGGGACAGTPLVCNTPPPASCTTATQSTTYAAVGTCTAGTCQYAPTTTSCANGCNAPSGLCNGDPCAGVTCVSPPSQCHQSVGTCTAGSCSYALRLAGTSCDDGDACTTLDACDSSGACAGEPVSCNSPPAAQCLDAATSRTFETGGSCSAGVCSYAPQDAVCTAGCDSASGLCLGDPCIGVTCASSPGPCFNDVGTCTGGTCDYAPRLVGTTCDDGDVCTFDDECSGAGVCAGTFDASCGAGGAGGTAGAGGGASGSAGAAGAAGLAGGAGSTASGGAAGASAGAGGASPDAGTAGSGVGASAGSGGAGAAVDAGSSGGADPGGAPASSGDDGGCGCRTANPRPVGGVPLALSLAALALLGRRRAAPPHHAR